MSRKLKDIRKRLEDIAADRRNFQLDERVPDIPVSYPLRETHSFVDASDVIGRDLDKKTIVELLLSNSSSSSSSENISVLPIVGLGGLGKTTLAKLVYNDDEIVSNFETRLWICVSEDFDLKKMIEKIMENATGADLAHLGLDQLQSRLRSYLNSKKFLLVLDDVWNEDRQKWSGLKDLLKCGSFGSKIMVTTRKKTTAEIMGTFPPYELKGLSTDESMSVFVKWAFKEGQEKEYPKLVEIGKAIVMKCGGLPLAVRSLGSLLYTKKEECEWLYIRDNDIWKIEQKENDILPVLKLSYDEMPLHLKQCFAYCAQLPKNCEIYNVNLIAQWMAHGFIQSSNGSRHLEDIGNQYFHELLSRSFFQDVEIATFDNSIIVVKMHDLMHDLALLVAGKEIANVKFDTTTISERTRHLLFCEGNLEGKEFPHFLLKLNKVQSFSFSFRVSGISRTFLDTLIKTFKCLRVLDLEGSDLEELPSYVGTLKHLRYLDISENSNIKALPNSISNLVNLQILRLGGCVMLQDLPRDFGNLWSLRNLVLTSQMTCFPRKGLLEGLISLQCLAIYNCYHLESLLEGMRNLTALRHLFIYQCPSLTSLPAESMRYLTSLETLVIHDCEKFNLFAKEQGMMELPRGMLSLSLSKIPALKELPRGFENAASTIKHLSIVDCPSFHILPEWLKKCTSLEKLELKDCMLLESLPLGMHQLTALQVLYIVNCSENLNRKCERKSGEYWPWIARIPEIINQFDSNPIVLN